MLKIIAIIIIITLTGCIAGQKNRQSGGDQQVSAPIINVPPAEKVDTADLKNDIGEKIIASSNATQNQLSGLVTTSISKISEKLTGVEANLHELLKVDANLSLELRNRIETAIKMTTEMQVELKNTMTISNNMQIKLEDLIKLHVTFDARLAAMAQAQVGWNNKIESKIDNSTQTFTSQAGRDVNMLPKTAVDIIISSYENFALALLLILTTATTVISLSFKYAKDKMTQDRDLEREEKRQHHELLLAVLADLPPEKAEGIKQKIPSIGAK